MKAARLHAVETPLSIDEVPIPQPGPGEVLLQVKACGVCTSDRYVIKGRRPLKIYPHTLGHEVTGVVASVGDDVAEFRPGDRVFINPMVSCGRCEWCLDGQDNLCAQGRLIGLDDGMVGGYAEYMSLPAKNVHRLPDNVTFEQGVIITSILATGFHAVRKIGVDAGDTVAVFGVGAIGCCVVQSAKAHGATRVIAVDLSDSKLERARPYGADEGINASLVDPVAEIMARTSGRGVDVAFDVAGEKATIEGAIGSLRRGGRAALVGCTFTPVHLDFEDYFRGVACKEVTMSTIFAYQAREFPLMVELLRAGKIDLSLYSAITFPLAEVNAALEASERETEAVRIILTP
ncbi:MAG: alcohol dehydrogenase catalytic domain-containing protein [Chloroflexi bacterium]|nr:alcohol dehydrogenase catalytic domain-containing protein [Chloroflexota bacterium]